MKETMIITFFLGALYALAAGAERIADNLPDIVAAILFLMLLAGFVCYLGSWLMDAVEREAMNEGDDGDRKEANPTDRR